MAAHATAAAALDAQGRRPEAEAEWRLVLAGDPASEMALDSLSSDLLQEKDYLGVVSLLGERRQSGTQSLPQALNLGEALALLARLDEALDTLQQGLRRFPGSVELENEKATVQILAGEHEKAYETLERTLQQHPGNRAAETLYLRALISGKSPRAGAWADRMELEHPQDAEMLSLSADLAWKTGDTAKSQELVKRSLALNPNDAGTQKLYGTLLAQAGELASAREHLERAIALGNTEPDVRYQLARVQARQGDTEGSRRTMEAYQSSKAADKARTDTAEEVQLGDQALKSGDAQGAAKLLQKALELSPNEPLIHYKLSRALDALHDLLGERAELQRALALNGTFAEALNQMGYLSLHEGDAASAESFFVAATRSAPAYVVAWNNLAAAYASDGRWQQAAKAADRALQIDPENRMAQKLKASIAASQSTP